MASPRQTYFCGSFKIEDDSILVSDIRKITDRLDLKLPKAGKYRGQYLDELQNLFSVKIKPDMCPSFGQPWFNKNPFKPKIL